MLQVSVVVLAAAVAEAGEVAEAVGEAAVVA